MSETVAQAGPGPDGSERAATLGTSEPPGQAGLAAVEAQAGLGALTPPSEGTPG